MERILGFTIKRRRSGLPTAGTGVFVSSGQVKAGALVALYPGNNPFFCRSNISFYYFNNVLCIIFTGTIYNLEPILLASIHNSYIFRCSDGLYIDGKSKGLSGRIYKYSLHYLLQFS